jgi:hypothetical protein
MPSWDQDEEFLLRPLELEPVQDNDDEDDDDEEGEDDDDMEDYDEDDDGDYDDDDDDGADYDGAQYAIRTTNSNNSNADRPGFVRALLDSAIPRDLRDNTVGIVKGDYTVERKTLLHHATTSDQYDLFTPNRRPFHRKPDP